MTFNRTVLSALNEWKGRAGGKRKPLVLRGARQTGKTTVVREFGKSFDTFISLNLEKADDRSYFSAEMNPRTAFQRICLDRRITPGGEVLLFLDEIQNSPEAVALLRYFYEEMPELHVIGAGSLLEIMMDVHKISFPVGRVEFLYLFPMTFREFLSATGEKQALSLLDEVPVPEWAVPSLFRLFRTYTLVGGMPEAVSEFAESGDVTRVSAVYRNLFAAYIDDAAKYASGRSEEQILRRFIESAPLETGKRITFERFANSSYRSRDAGEALRTLQRAMLLYLRYPTTALRLPLATDEKRRPRLQFLDTGMVNYVAGIQGAYLTDTPIDSMFGGMIAEQVVGQELLAANYNELKKPLFWVREDPRSNAELDFLLVKDAQVVPVEVKSGKNGTLRSLHSFIDLSGTRTAVRLYSGSISTERAKTPSGTPYTLVNLPLFLADSILKYV